MRHPTPGSADLCFIVEEAIDEVADELRAKSVRVIQGPCERTGAKQRLRSIYLYDPDENLVELSNEIH